MSFPFKIPNEILDLVTSDLSPEDHFSLIQTNTSLAFRAVRSAIALRYSSAIPLDRTVQETPNNGPPQSVLALCDKPSNACSQTIRESPNSDPSTMELCYSDRTLLHHVVENSGDDPATIQYLLSFCAETHTLLNLPDTHGLAPLHLAASSSVAICKALLKAGAEINAKNNMEETPLFVAVEAGRADVVKCLLDHGADITVKAKDSNLTALQKAMMFGEEEVVSCLYKKIDEGEVGVYGKGGCAPLCHATSEGFIKAMNEMREAGINPFSQEENGESLPALAVIARWRNAGTRVSSVENKEKMDREDDAGFQLEKRKRAREESWEEEMRIEKRMKTKEDLREMMRMIPRGIARKLGTV